jgi:hypothetical protein
MGPRDAVAQSGTEQEVAQKPASIGKHAFIGGAIGFAIDLAIVIYVGYVLSQMEDAHGNED